MPGPVDLLPALQYALGEAVFLRLVDADQNRDSSLIDTVLLQLTVSATADSELVRLAETAVASGIFSGYIQSIDAPAVPNDCVLQAARDQTFVVAYADAFDPSDTSSAIALMSPQSRVLDSASGSLVGGASIILVDDVSGLPATVFGDDGTSIFPSTVVSGGTATDSGGTVYTFAPGTYRFPFVPAGTYRLDVTSPSGFVAPSAVATSTLQALPGAPFAIVVGSRGEPVTVAAGSAISVDIPLDPLTNDLFLSKTSSREVVGLGELVQYNIRVRNPGASAAPAGVAVTDVLPVGFRYRAGSTRIDGAPAPDPAVSGDGRTLTYSLGPTPLVQFQNIRYVAEVTTGAPRGAATNRATSQLVGLAQSYTAKATVLVRDDLFSGESFLLGQVVSGSCDDQVTNDHEGLAGVRIYLEDGTYAVTDARGLFQFEGIAPGVHVVQLDVDSLPPSYQPLPCERNTRFAGRAFSQFADVQPGTLWRTDFHVELRPLETGYVNLELKSDAEGDVIAQKVELNGGFVPVRNLRAVVSLSEGARYVPGSSRLDGQPLADPSISDGVLTYGLGELTGNWSRALEFRTRVLERDDDWRLKTSAFALFQTPTKRSELTPVAKSFSVRDSRAASGVQIVKTTGLRPGEVWAEESAAPSSAEGPPTFDRAWLEGADPELEWLRPAPGFAPRIPAIHIWIKHPAGDRLTLLQNGEEVSRFNFEGWVRNSSRTVTISRWRGVDLVEGDNRFEVIARGPDGEVSGTLQSAVHYSGPPVSVELVRDASKPIADGRTPPVIAVRFRDRFGHPVREGVVGELEVEPPHESYEEHRALQVRQLAGLAPEKPSYAVGADGIARIRLRPTTEAGRAVLRFALNDGRRGEVRLWLEPEERDWVLVGLAEGTVGHNRLTGNMEALDAHDFEDRLYLDERVALFAKGRVKGQWLLTLAYDSWEQKEPLGESLSQLIDPDTYYTLYGSTSEQGYDAPTSSKLYLRLERQNFYALFGDYDSGLGATELSRYSRSFTGLKSEYDGDHLSFSAFAANTDQGFNRDEIPGDGTSGLYRLSQRNIVRNSEKVTIETRDRFKSEVIVNSESMTRHLDYNIDYDAGTLFFKKPIPAKSAEFDPVSIVVEYESEDERDRAVVAGGRGAVKLLGERLELGASGIREGNSGTGGELVGFDLRYQLHPTTEVRAEFARTEAEDAGVGRNGDAFLAELATEGARLDARAYFRREDRGFGLGQQNRSELGMRKLGVEGRFRMSDQLGLNGEAYRQTNLETDAERDVLEGRAEYREQNVYMFGGLRMAQDRFETAPDAVSQQLIGGGSYAVLGRRLLLRLTSEISIGGRDESIDFPSRTILGADFQVNPKLLAFAEHEFAFGNDVQANGTRVGLRSTPWRGGQASAALEQRLTENGARTFANLGLSQTWQVSDRWSLDASLDRTQTLRSPTTELVNPDAPLSSGTFDDDFTALSFGPTYRADRWSWTLRLETRLGDQEDKWGLVTGFHREVSQGIGYSASLQLLDADPELGSHSTTGDLRVGFVYRPLGTRWILLDQVDLRFDHQRGGTFGFNNRKLVNNLNLNYQWNRRVQVSLQYGAKYLLDTIDSERYRGYTDLMGLELRRDLGASWDLSAAARMRHSWTSDVYAPSYGISLGHKLATNLWVSAGYNFAGFRDDDFSGADYTAEGPFIRFRYKFDQGTIAELFNRWEL